MKCFIRLLAITTSLLDIYGAFPRATAFPEIANHSGSQHATPAHHGVKYYFRVWPGLQTTKHLPSPKAPVSLRTTSSNADSFKTTASRRITSSAGTVASSSTTSFPRPAAFPGIANLPMPSHLPVIPPLPIVPNLPAPQQLPSQKTAVPPRTATSLKTVASRRIASTTTPITSPGTTQSIKTKASPRTKPPTKTTSSAKTAKSPRTTSSTRTTASPSTTLSRKTTTSRRTRPSTRTTASPSTTLSRKTAASRRTRPSTRTTASPSTTLSRKTTASRRTRPSTRTTASPTTTSSPRIDNTTEEISWEPKKLQEFAERLQKGCDFDLLDATSKDLKNLWGEVKEERDEPMSSELIDMQVLLKKIIDFYNDCIEAMADIDPARQFEIYLKIFGKEYNANATEKEIRKEIFKKNKEEVEEHNELYKKGRVTFKAGLNHLSDWTEEELERMNGFRLPNQTSHGSSKRKERFADQHIWSYYSYNPYISVPASFDWRTKGSYVTPVRNQGSCGSCYAFAGIGALEAYHKKIKGELVTLSVQNILDCTWYLGNDGCMGGTINTVFRYAGSAGVVSDIHYPYTANASYYCRWRRANVVANVIGYYIVEHDSELALQSAVAIQGPTAAPIGTRHLRKYRSGIFAMEDCGDTDHGVLIVGYGTDPKYGDFWIVKNCWGHWWGENGYFRIARNRNNMCNIASYASFPC